MTIRVHFIYHDGTNDSSTWPEPQPKWAMQRAAWMRDAAMWSEEEVEREEVE